jgi:hypothetical protein
MMKMDLLPNFLRSGMRRVRDVQGRRRYGITDPVVVFQMGKVGSTGVYRALVAANLGVPVHHVHLMEDLDAIEDGVRRLYPNPVHTLREIEKGRRIRRELDQRRSRGSNVVTLVRDPVARNVSAFFEGIEEVLPEARTLLSTDAPHDELLDAFLNRFDNGAPLGWFDGQMKPVFGIDVFATPFPHERGFQIIEGNSARVLILRTADLAQASADAFRSFLGVTLGPLGVQNDSAGKWYADAYRDFLARLRLPDGYLDEMYDSRMARHFFSPQEIEQFRAGWRSR